MVEENNNIFLAGVDPLVHSTEQIHKKYSTAFVWGYPLSTYASYDITPYPLYAYVRNSPFAHVISSIWYSSLPFWLCSFAIAFSCCFRNSRINGFIYDTHHFLASHSVSSSLPRKAFSLMVASNCQLFGLSWSLAKLSYANAKESYSWRTTTVIVSVLTKVLSFS